MKKDYFYPQYFALSILFTAVNLFSAYVMWKAIIATTVTQMVVRAELTAIFVFGALVAMKIGYDIVQRWRRL